jgi:hypothetical protein
VPRGIRPVPACSQRRAQAAHAECAYRARMK